jgi:hypothetical protein
MVETLCVLNDLEAESLATSWDKVLQITQKLNQSIRCNYTPERTLDAIVLAKKGGSSEQGGEGLARQSTTKRECAWQSTIA